MHNTMILTMHAYNTHGESYDRIYFFLQFRGSIPTLKEHSTCRFTQDGNLAGMEVALVPHVANHSCNGMNG